MKTYQQGSSNLVLVLIVATVISILSTGILMFTLFSRKVTQISISSSQSLYLAEGKMYELISLLKNESHTLTFPIEEITQIDENSIIYHQIIFQDDGYYIKVISEVNGANRAFEAFLSLSETYTNKLDVMLVIDKSGDLGPAINDIKTGALEFVETVYESDVEAQVGMVYFEDNTPSRDFYPLTTARIDLENGISSANASGENNFELALVQAIDELDLYAQEDSKKVVVVFADGVPNLSLSNSCPENYCLWNTPTGFAPDDRGHSCTNDAIQQANEGRYEFIPGTLDQREYVFFSISYLGNYNKHHNDCSVLYGSKEAGVEKTKELGRRTLLRVSNEDPLQELPEEGQDLEFFYEAETSEEISEAFQAIADVVISPGFFSYREIEPEPIPEL